MQTASGLIGFPAVVLVAPFPTWRSDIHCPPSTAYLRKRFHPLLSVLLFRVFPSRFRSVPLSLGASFLGVAFPHRGVSQQRPRVELPGPGTFPSSTFLTSSTACSATSLVGLFHPTTTSRVFPSGAFPPAQPHRLVGDPCPLVVSGDSLPTHCCVSATSRRPALRAFICAGIRCRCARV